MRLAIWLHSAELGVAPFWKPPDPRPKARIRHTPLIYPTNNSGT